MPHVTLQFLGRFSVTVDTNPVTNFHSDKARALLAYLALEPREQSRTQLAALLWPEIDDQYARTNLRNTLHRLRQTLDGAAPDAADQLLTVTRQTVQFNRQSADVDVHRFQQRIDRASASPATQIDELTAAVDAYQGELLAGFGVADAPPFEEWLLLRREALQQRALLAFHTLTTAHESAGNLSQAHAVANRLLMLDPFREESHRQLMRLLARMGQPQQALQQMEKLRRILHEDMGVEPDAATVALAKQIAAGEFDKVTGRQEDKRDGGQARPEHSQRDDTRTSTATPGTLSPPPPVIPSSDHPLPPASIFNLNDVPDPGPFFGRVQEHRQLVQWIAHERCKVVAILGLGGMGKTTLAAQCVRQSAVQRTVEPFDAIVWRSLVNVPPLTELLPPLLQTLSAQQLTQMPASVDEQLRLLLGYLREQRVLLILDNMESILEPERAGTYRAGYEAYGQLIQQMATLDHQSHLLLTSRERPQGYARLERDGRPVQSLQLSGLDDVAGRALLAQRGIAAEGAAESQLIQRYSGNPLALKLVADTVDEIFGGDIDEFLADETFIFDDIRTVLDQHFGRLTSLEQQILFWLAVEREPTSPHSLRESLLRPPNQRDFVEALRSLQRRSLVETVGTDLALQNVVTEYLTERLIEIAVEEISSGAPQRLQQQALLKAQAKDYVRESQVRLILQPIGAQLVERFGRTGLQAKIQQILTDLRVNSPHAPHYVGGNLLNLLLALEIDLRGYDFSQLSIWQAHLQNAELPAVNFSGVHFADTLFIDRFGAINALALDAQNSYLASAANGDSLIRLWRLRDGQLLMTLAGHAQTCTALAFHPAGQLLASGSVDNTIRLWDVTSGRTVATLRGAHDSQITSVVFSPNGALLATGGPGAAVCIWAVATGQLLATLPPHVGFLRPIIFHPDGQVLVTKSSRDIHFWSLQTVSVQPVPTATAAEPVPHISTLQPPEMAPLCFAFRPDGTQLAIGTEEGPVYLWDVAQERLSPPLIGHTVPVIEVAYSPDGQLLASSSRDGTVRLWDVVTAQPLDRLQGHLGAVWAICISADGETLVSGGGDGVIRQWELKSVGQRRILRTFRGDLREIKGIALSTPEGHSDALYLAAGSKNGRCHLWQFAQHRAQSRDPQSATNVGREQMGTFPALYLQSLRGHVGSINSVALRPHSTQLATAGDDHTVRIWDLARKASVAILREHVADVRSLAYSSQGNLLAGAAGDGIIHLWRVDQLGHHELQQTIYEASASEVLTFSADEKSLIYSLVGNTIVLWDIEQGEPLQRATGASAAAWALDLDATERRMVTGHLDGAIYLWELTDRRLATPPRTMGHHKQAVIHTIRFNPTGDFVVSGGFDSALYVWDPVTGALLHQLNVFNDGVNDVRFLPESNILLAACFDGAVRIYDVAHGALLATLNIPGPYEGMKITGVTGITDAQRDALKALGAVET